MNNLKYYILLATTAAIWGFQPVCVRWAEEFWTPETITAVLYIFLGIVLLMYAYHKEGKSALLISPRQFLLLLVMGLCGMALNNVLQFTAIKYTTITICTLMTGLTPCMTAIGAFFFLKERHGALVWLGIFISFLGVFTIVTKGSWRVLANSAFNVGDILSFASQVAWSCYSLLGIVAMRKMSPLTMSGWTGLLGGLIVLGWGICTDTFRLSALPAVPLLVFLYIVLFGGIFAIVSWNLGCRKVGPSIATIFFNILPIVGMLSGYLLFAEPIGTIQIFGAACTLLGVTLVTNHKYVEACFTKKRA